MRAPLRVMPVLMSPLQRGDQSSRHRAVLVAIHHSSSSGIRTTERGGGMHERYIAT